MILHFLAPEDKTSWRPIWDKCFNSWGKYKDNIKLWNDDEIIDYLVKDDKKFYQMYLSKLPFIYSLDYVRYLILRDYNGLYIDLDIELKVDFIPMLKPNNLYIMEGSLGEYVTNALMGGQLKDTKIWNIIANDSKYQIIHNIKDCSANVIYTLENVGPMFLSRWFSLNREWLNINNINFQLLGASAFNKPTSDVYFCKHHHTNSWVPPVPN